MSEHVYLEKKGTKPISIADYQPCYLSADKKLSNFYAEHSTGWITFEGFKGLAALITT